MHVCMYTMCKPVACRGQKRKMDPLELELHAAMSCYVDAAN